MNRRDRDLGDAPGLLVRSADVLDLGSLLAVVLGAAVGVLGLGGALFGRQQLAGRRPLEVDEGAAVDDLLGEHGAGRVALARLDGPAGRLAAERLQRPALARLDHLAKGGREAVAAKI